MSLAIKLSLKHKSFYCCCCCGKGFSSFSFCFIGFFCFFFWIHCCGRIQMTTFIKCWSVDYWLLFRSLSLRHFNTDAWPDREMCATFSFICVLSNLHTKAVFVQKESSESIVETVKSINENRIKITHHVCVCIAVDVCVCVCVKWAHIYLSWLPGCHLFTCNQTNYAQPIKLYVVFVLFNCFSPFVIILHLFDCKRALLSLSVHGLFFSDVVVFVPKIK